MYTFCYNLGIHLIQALYNHTYNSAIVKTLQSFMQLSYCLETKVPIYFIHCAQALIIHTIQHHAKASVTNNLASLQKF